jgi:thiamine-phosphate pyrophosphorylase
MKVGVGLKMQDRLRGLYVITDDSLTPLKSVEKYVKMALVGGAKIVQLRDKISCDEVIEKTALKLQELCESHGALFVLNDRVELAIKLNLSGLHIGESDHHRFDEIRADFKNILGVSCYGSIDMALDFGKRGASYVAFGSFFTSPTKPNAKVVSLETLGLAKTQINIPICAIGGINSSNLSKVMAHKVDMVCVISDIWKSDDITQQAKVYSDGYID